MKKYMLIEKNKKKNKRKREMSPNLSFTSMKNILVSRLYFEVL